LLPFLGAAYASRLPVQALPAPHWVARNLPLAQNWGINPDWLQSDAALALLAGNRENAAEFHASVYSGHQFGHWAGQLGDGRALSLGQIDTLQGVQEIQLKGAGRTPYSRGGDGRAVLRSTVREYLASIAMQGLGIPSTAALAIVGSPAPVQREEVESAAVLTRSAPSFIRFGHFEHFAAHAARTGDSLLLQTLVDTTIARYYPDCQGAEQPVLAWLGQVVQRSAELVAAWQAVGFCHGVMNTDNMSILGLTLDYGPYQWLDAYDPEHICNHSDTQGRYRYSRQPAVMRWNLFCLGQSLLPVLAKTLGEDAASAGLITELEKFGEAYSRAWQSRMAAKLGLAQLDAASLALLQQLLDLLAHNRADWTIFWRRWARAMNDYTAEAARTAEAAEAAEATATATATATAMAMATAFHPVRDLFIQREAFDAWLADFLAFLAPQLLQTDTQTGTQSAIAATLHCNPSIVLRNHLAQEAIAAAETGDFAPLAQLANALRSPYAEQTGCEHYAAFPPDWAAGIAVSCSS
jgi:uncharacterized protein YdiU (UPF0061 family)